MCGLPRRLNSTRSIALASVAVPTVERGVRAHPLLIDDDRGRQPVQDVDFRPADRRHESLQERAVSLVDQPLRLGRDRAEHQRRLSRSRDAGEHGQPAFGEPDADVLQVVLAGALDANEVMGVGGVRAGGGHVRGHVIQYRRARGTADRCKQPRSELRAFQRSDWRVRVDVVHRLMTAHAAGRLLQRGRRISQLRSRSSLSISLSASTVFQNGNRRLMCPVAHRPQSRRRVAIALPAGRGRPRGSFATDPRCTCRNRRDPDCCCAGLRPRGRDSRSKPSSAASSARLIPESRTASCLSAREASSPRMWRADAEAMRSPVNRTIPFERSDGKPANVSA